MIAAGFSNSFNSGEICDDAWDRTDLQPLAKGCELAENYLPRIAGPLGKRRGFWRNGTLVDQAKKGRIVPFRRSVDDALMLEFGDTTVRVWQANGAPLMDGGGPPAQVQFGSPYGTADIPGLRWRQVGDVIYFRTSNGLRPQALVRTSNTSWAFNQTTYTNGPWLPENIDRGFTITVTGSDEADTNPDTTFSGSIRNPNAVALVASSNLFDVGQIGGYFRVRASDGAPSVASWKPGYRPNSVGWYNLSVGHVYRMASKGSDDTHVTTPPVQLSGVQSDGGNVWDYRHDGAGVILITAVTDAQNASGTVINTVPFISGASTSYWAEGAYSDYRGWPRMWPSIREERLVDGATANNLDFLDLTETSGFTPNSESFTPGLGTGAVVDTDAVRRRIGDSGAELLWSMVATYLLVGTTDAEYLIGGSVLDEPISPSTVVTKPLSGFGSADVAPVKAHKGVLYVTRGGQTVRELTVDTSQVASTDDLTVLATHIGVRGFAQLAWVPQPDNTLWARLGDGGLAAMVYHQEQQVRGWARQALPYGFTVEDMAVLPGPGQQETLWLIVHRVKGGDDQRQIWMYSIPSDGLFMDGAQAYAGAPETVFSGLDDFDGEAVRILADGAQQPDQAVSAGDVTLKAAASNVLVGAPMVSLFVSLKLDLQGSINSRQRIAGCTVSMKTAKALVGRQGYELETFSPRLLADVPTPQARRGIKAVNFVGDTDRDPRIVIVDNTAYDSVVYSLKPKVAVGG